MDLYTNRQQTQNIFIDFCQKFSNLQVLKINNAGIESVDEDSLLNCKNLEDLDLEGNNIQELPEDLLIRNSKLIRIWLKNNQLTTLPEDLFFKQKDLESLVLQENKINLLPSNIFRPLVKLEILYLGENKLQAINPVWFATLQNLKWLSLSGNQISEVPSKVFAPLRNLERLWLYENKIKILHPNSFDGLQNLQLLSLYTNEISDLPAGIFIQLKNLQVLLLSDNKLTFIHSDSFGVHNQLTRIYLQNNQIKGIDGKFIESNAASYLNMTGNVCSQSELKSRNDIKQNLRNCFNNYKPRPQPQSNDRSSTASQNDAGSCGKQTTGQGNIIGGTQAVRGNFPWIAVLIKTNGKYFCAGTLVSDQKVITAAHCIQDKGNSEPLLKRDLNVLLGAFDLDNPFEAGRSLHAVQSINMHPDWNPQAESYDADITVLVLEEQAAFNTHVRPICMETSDIAAITTGLIVGYGRSEDGSKAHENIPKILEAPIHDNLDCFFKFNVLLKLSSKRTFCGGPGNGTGVCNGDSGGGLIVSVGDTFYLRAVVSSSLVGGPYGCNVDTYSVFTDVLPYIDWINGVSTSRFKRSQ